MSLQQVEYSSIVHPLQALFAKGGGQQGGQAASRPKKATAKKATKGSGKKQPNRAKGH